jgi:hypothetical protein
VKAHSWIMILGKVSVDFRLENAKLDTFGGKRLLDNLTSDVTLFRSWA